MSTKARLSPRPASPRNAKSATFAPDVVVTADDGAAPMLGGGGGGGGQPLLTSNPVARVVPVPAAMPRFESLHNKVLFFRTVDRMTSRNGRVRRVLYVTPPGQVCVCDETGFAKRAANAFQLTSVVRDATVVLLCFANEHDLGLDFRSCPSGVADKFIALMQTFAPTVSVTRAADGTVTDFALALKKPLGFQPPARMPMLESTVKREMQIKRNKTNATSLRRSSLVPLPTTPSAAKSMGGSTSSVGNASFASAGTDRSAGTTPKARGGSETGTGIVKLKRKVSIMLYPTASHDAEQSATDCPDAVLVEDALAAYRMPLSAPAPASDDGTTSWVDCEDPGDLVFDTPCKPTPPSPAAPTDPAEDARLRHNLVNEYSDLQEEKAHIGAELEAVRARLAACGQYVRAAEQELNLALIVRYITRKATLRFAPSGLASVVPNDTPRQR